MAKKKSLGAKVAPLRALTCAALQDWLIANLGIVRLRKEGHATPMDAARWFCANLLAEDLANCSTRELAHYILKPDRLKTARDITRSLSGYAWDDPQSMAECLYLFNAVLCEFWGLT